MQDDKKQIAVALPGEWALQKVLGPALDEIGTDIGKLYLLGRNKIAEAALRKMRNTQDNARANLRVARDVFWNGSFTDESICAEYFGGILAASRSADGKDDAGIFFVDIIKSLSSGQLKMHYILYRSLNKYLLADASKKDLNPGQEQELGAINSFIPLTKIMRQLLPEDLGAILHGLNSKGLIGNFQTESQDFESGAYLPYLSFHATSLGVQLFAIANNMFSDWRNYPKVDFGDFNDIVLPEAYEESLSKLLEKVAPGQTIVAKT